MSSDLHAGFRVTFLFCEILPLLRVRDHHILILSPQLTSLPLWTLASTRLSNTFFQNESESSITASLLFFPHLRVATWLCAPVARLQPVPPLFPLARRRRHGPYGELGGVCRDSGIDLELGCLPRPEHRHRHAVCLLSTFPLCACLSHPPPSFSLTTTPPQPSTLLTPSSQGRLPRPTRRPSPDRHHHPSCQGPRAGTLRMPRVHLSPELPQ